MGWVLLCKTTVPTMSHSQFAGQQLSVNDLPVVMEELSDIRANWYNIGLQLRLRVGTLDAIKEQYDDPSHCLRETLKTWLKTCPSPPTWKNIVEALRSRIIGEVRLAADLEQKYCSTQDTSVAATYHHILPAPSSQADTQTTSPQHHVPPAPLVSPPNTSPVPPSATVATHPDLPPPHTIGIKAEISIFCTMFHLKSILLYWYIATCTAILRGSDPVLKHGI